MKYQIISLFTAKGAIYYVTIATVIFSGVKITCYFQVWRYHVFAKLTWYFIGVYIINNFNKFRNLVSDVLSNDSCFLLVVTALFYLFY